MEQVSRRGFALAAAVGAALIPSIALAAAPVNVRSVAILADVAGASIASGDCLYVEGKSSRRDGFEGLFVARPKLVGEVPDQVLTLASTAGPTLVWERQITDQTYLSSWWVTDRSASAPACNQALNTMFTRVPVSDCTVVICSGIYRLGDAANWEPVTLASKTRVAVVAQSGAIFTPTGAIPRDVVPNFQRPLMHVENCIACTVSGLTFDAGAGGASGTSIAGLSVAQSQYCQFLDLEGFGFGSHAIFSEVACVGSSWESCYAHDSINTCRGFWLGHTASSAEIGSWVTKELKVHHCRAINNDATGIVISADGASAMGNTSSDNNGAGIISSAADGFTVRRHVIVGNICQGNAFVGYGTDVYASNPADYPYDLTIVSNVFNENGNGGMLLDRCRRVTVSANICSRNGSATLFGYGIQLIGSSSNISIASNDCSDDRSPRYQGSGIAVLIQAHSLSYVSVAANTCTGTLRGIQIETVAVAGSSIVGLNVSGNVARSNTEYGIMLAQGAGTTFEDVVVSGNNCRGNSPTDLRCTVAGAKLRANTYSTFNFGTGVPYYTYASDASAGTGGLKKGEEYQTATGELRVKL